MAIKVVSFDFWGTLYRNKVSLRHERLARIRPVLDQHGYDGIPDERIYQAMEDAWVIWDDIWRIEQRTLGARDFLELVFKDLSVQLPELALQTLSYTIQEAVFTPNTVPIDYVIESVAILAQRCKIGVISDTGVSSGAYLSKLIDRDHPSIFSFRLYSDELGMSKPQQPIFKRVLEINGCTPEEVVHVGDLRHTDILGAKQAGMYTVRYAGVRDDQDERFPEAHWVISDYRTLPEIVRSIS